MNGTTTLDTSNRLRNHTAQDFIDAWHNAETENERAEVRSRLKRLDSGRWHDVLDEAHNHVAHADLAARKTLEEVYGTEFLWWIGVFGLVEELNTFEDMTGVQK